MPGLALIGDSNANTAVSGDVAGVNGLPVGTTQGDLLFIPVAFKPASGTLATPAGWNTTTVRTVGTGTAGDGTGQIKIVLFWQIVPASPTVPSLAPTGTGAVRTAGFVLFRPDTGWTVEISGSVGSDTTSDTTFAVTGDTVLPYTTNDWAMIVHAVTQNITDFSLEGLWSPPPAGSTFNNNLDSKWRSGGNSGDNLRSETLTSPCHGGPATGAPSFSTTIAAATTGGAVFYRLHPVHYPWHVLNIDGTSTGNHFKLQSATNGGSTVTEDFEDTTYAFPVNGAWARDSTSPKSGSAWSLRSAAIGHSQTTDATVTVPDGMTSVQFWHRVSSESGFDFFRFLIDGAVQFSTSGNGTWTQSSVYAVTPGQVLTFRYTKDGSDVANLDAAFIDELVFSGAASTFFEKTRSEIAAGYYEDPYFFPVGADQEWVQFWVRLDSATTSGSSYARSELREMQSNGTSEMAFNTATGTHRLRARMRVTHLPPVKPTVVFAQIHDGGSDVLQLVTELNSTTGLVEVKCRINGTSSGQPKLKLDYQIGDIHEFMVEVVDGVTKVYWDDLHQPAITTTAVSTTTAYFKAGCYSQSNETIDSATEWMSVDLQNLRAWHTGQAGDTGAPPPVFSPPLPRARSRHLLVR